MTHEESERIFKALRRYYPHAKIYKDHDRLEAYRARLLRYKYAEVVAAGKEYVDKNKFFPDLPDLVGSLKPTDAPAETRRDPSRNAWMDEYIERVDRLVEEHGGVCQLLHSHGCEGTCGEVHRKYYPHPDYCGEKCRKVAYYGECPQEAILRKGV